ncbi:MAG: hypothetical protein ACHQFX_03525 [Chitinophagales bacterium]
MPKEDIKDLSKFLKPFPPEVKELALWLREFVWDLYPNSNELIYDNYNALAFGWSPTDRVGDVFCNIAVGRSTHNVHFGFYWGAKIADPEKRLIGQGNQYRYLLVKSKKDFPKTYLKTLMKEAYAYSLGKMKTPKQVLKGATITKSISAKKRG